MSPLGTRLLALAFLAQPVGAAAQSTHPLIGEWAIQYEGGATIENGVRTPFMVDARLSVVATGDSLVATMVSEPQPGFPTRPPSRMAARRSDGPMTFLRTSTATVSTNGEQESFEVRTQWTLDARDDALTGSLVMLDSGPIDLGPDGKAPRPVRGTRQKP